MCQWFCIEKEAVEAASKDGYYKKGTPRNTKGVVSLKIIPCNFLRKKGIFSHLYNLL